MNRPGERHERNGNKQGAFRPSASAAPPGSHVDRIILLSEEDGATRLPTLRIWGPKETRKQTPG